MIKSIKVLKSGIPLLLAAFYLFLLVYQAEKVAITDDARFYMEAGESYANDFSKGLKKFSYFDKKFIDRYWEKNHEHPPFAKILMAGGYLAFYKGLKIMKKTVALRVGISIFAAIFLFFLFDFVRRASSFNAAVFTTLFFIFLPRTFFHARIATLDFAVLATSFMFVYSYYRGLSSRFWAWMTGVFFGVAISTKLNAPFMVFPVVVHYFWIKRGDLRSRPFKTIFAPHFLSMLFFAIPLFFAMWPWLWHNTLERFVFYAKFHIKHYGILMYYLGDIYRTPRPPWHAPMVMMILTTPTLTLIPAALSFFFYRWKDEKKRNSPMLLVALSAFISIAVLMFMPAPFYSGVKLFQPFYPFLAILAGVGLYHILRGITIVPKRYRFAPFVIFFIPVILNFIDLKHDHLSYYSEFAGGAKGALEYRNERHYYDLFYSEMAEFFNRECEKKFCKVKIVPNGGEYRYSSGILKKSDLLTKKFIYTDRDNANYFILTHEYRWGHYPDLLRKYRRMKVVHTVSRQGVPLFTIFKKK